MQLSRQRPGDVGSTIERSTRSVTGEAICSSGGATQLNGAGNPGRGTAAGPPVRNGEGGVGGAVLMWADIIPRW